MEGVEGSTVSAGALEKRRAKNRERRQKRKEAKQLRLRNGNQQPQLLAQSKRLLAESKRLLAESKRPATATPKKKKTAKRVTLPPLSAARRHR